MSNNGPDIDAAPEPGRLRGVITFVPHSRFLPRALWRPAIFFFALAQVFLSFAPLLEARQGPDAHAHVEELGTTLHHAHNEADCAACIARTLLASSDPEVIQPQGVVSTSALKPDEASLPLTSAWTVLARSRAPPLQTV
jgi:hypothetical protein